MLLMMEWAMLSVFACCSIYIVHPGYEIRANDENVSAVNVFKPDVSTTVFNLENKVIC